MQEKLESSVDVAKKVLENNADMLFDNEVSQFHHKILPETVAAIKSAWSLVMNIDDSTDVKADNHV